MGVGAAAPRNPELITVGPDEVVVTCTTEVDATVVTRVGDHEVATTGTRHVARVGGLAPDTEYGLAVEGARPDAWLPPLVHTLARPRGRLLATLATTNDVHFGETEAGRSGDPATDAIGPILRAEPGDDPYPEVMSRAAVAEIAALDPDAVVVKGDLTDRGTEEQYEAFLAVYGALGERMHHVRGNHDAMTDPTLATEGAPYEVRVGDVSLAVLDTVVPGIDGGQLPSDQVEWLDALAGERSGPVLVFGHHHCWNLESTRRPERYFGIRPADSEALASVVARRETIVGYFAGHTHTNRVRRFRATGTVPFVEVGCTKDYPGAWAEYRVYEHGFTQVVRRVAAPDAFDWAERTRHMFQGVYRDVVLGDVAARCFTQSF